MYATPCVYTLRTINHARKTGRRNNMLFDENTNAVSAVDYPLRKGGGTLLSLQRNCCCFCRSRAFNISPNRLYAVSSYENDEKEEEKKKQNKNNIIICMYKSCARRRRVKIYWSVLGKTVLPNTQYCRSPHDADRVF